jgi:CHRD domain-containing protein
MDLKNIVGKISCYKNTHSCSTMSYNAYCKKGPSESCPPEFFSKLDGCQVVPPVSTWGNGQAWMQLTPGYDALTYTIQVKDLSSPITAAHFHDGKKGVSGPPLFPIPFQPLANGVWAAGGVGTPIAPDQLVKLLTSGIYIMIHTETYPDGEVRGQIYPKCPEARYKGCPPKKECPVYPKDPCCVKPYPPPYYGGHVE